MYLFNDEKVSNDRERECSMGYGENPIKVQTKESLINWGIEVDWIESAVCDPIWSNGPIYMLCDSELRSMFGDVIEIKYRPDGVDVGDNFISNEMIAGVFLSLSELKSEKKIISQRNVLDRYKKHTGLSDWRTYVPFDFRERVVTKGQSKLLVNVLETLLPFSFPSDDEMKIIVAGSSAPGDKSGLSYIVLSDIMNELKQPCVVQLYDLTESGVIVQDGCVRIESKVEYINKPLTSHIVIDDRWQPTLSNKLPEISSKSKVFSIKAFDNYLTRFQAFYPNDGHHKTEYRQMNFEYYPLARIKYRCLCSDCCYVIHLLHDLNFSERLRNNIISFLYAESGHDMLSHSKDYFMTVKLRAQVFKHKKIDKDLLMSIYTPTVVQACYGHYPGVKGFPIISHDIHFLFLNIKSPFVSELKLHASRFKLPVFSLEIEEPSYDPRVLVLTENFVLIMIKKYMFDSFIQFFSLPAILYADDESFLLFENMAQWDIVYTIGLVKCYVRHTLKDIVPSITSEDVFFDKQLLTNTCVVVVWSGLKFLLLEVKRKKKNFLDFPKGRRLSHESEFDCAKRELKEETGIVCDPVKCFNALVEFSPLKKTVMSVFSVCVTNPRVILSKEHFSFGWYERVPRRAESWVHHLISEMSFKDSNVSKKEVCLDNGNSW